MTIWRCEMCNFEYDEAVGWDDYEIPPGTAGEDIPNDWWQCPWCGASKRDFVVDEVVPA